MYVLYIGGSSLCIHGRVNILKLNLKNRTFIFVNRPYGSHGVASGRTVFPFYFKKGRKSLEPVRNQADRQLSMRCDEKCKSNSMGREGLGQGELGREQRMARQGIGPQDSHQLLVQWLLLKVDIGSVPYVCLDM